MEALSNSDQRSAPAPIRAWLLAMRPKTLPAGAIPVLVGTAVAASSGQWSLLPALAALAGALLLQIGSNLANDLFDFINGTDDHDRLGPARAAQQGWLSVRQLGWATAVVFALAAGIGVYLTLVAGWIIVAIGLAGIAGAILYTGGPVPLGYIGLGDLMVFVFFGPVAVLGTSLVVSGSVGTPAMLASVAVGALATAILVVNNLRDRQSDARTGKRTLAVRLGATGARVEYLLLVSAAYVAVAVTPVFTDAGWGWLLPLATLPLAAHRIRRVWTLDGRPLNQELAATAQLMALFGLLLAVGSLL